MQVYLQRNEDRTIRADHVHVESWDHRRGPDVDSLFLKELNTEYETEGVKDVLIARMKIAEKIPKYYAPMWLFVFGPHEDILEKKNKNSTQ